MAASSSVGRPAAASPAQIGAERARERLRLVVAGARDREDVTALRNRHLADDVRGGAETVEPERLRVAREPERPVADQPGAEQRRASSSPYPSGIGKQKRSSATASSA